MLQIYYGNNLCSLLFKELKTHIFNGIMIHSFFDLVKFTNAQKGDILTLEHI